MSVATRDDYAWLGHSSLGLAEGYYLTLAEGISPQEFLVRIGSELQDRADGIQGLRDREEAFFDSGRYCDELLVGVAAVEGMGGAWAMGLATDSCIGVFDELMVPLSAGCRMITHGRNVNAVDLFRWYEDGELRTHFEPLFPTDRMGSDPDALVEEMRGAGFNLSDQPGHEGHTAATFALAERLTGVRVTEALLSTSTYWPGCVEIPDP